MRHISLRHSGSYAGIQDWVQAQYGFVPKTCWIADCKQQCGIPMRVASNRKGHQRLVPCPPEKEFAIKNAFRHFGLL